MQHNAPSEPPLPDTCPPGVTEAQAWREKVAPLDEALEELCERYGAKLVMRRAVLTWEGSAQGQQSEREAREERHRQQEAEHRALSARQKAIKERLAAKALGKK